MILIITFFVYTHMDILFESIKQGLPSAIIIVVYLIIIKIIDAKRESDQTKLNANVVKSITNVSNFITDISKNIIDSNKDKCKIAIESSINASAMILMNFVSTTIINNHIETNKETIISNIKNLVNTEYYNIYSILSLYIINNKRVSDYLKKEWMDDVEKIIIDSIYNNKLNNEDKIFTFNNKINIKFQSYITYINNNILY